METKFRDLIFRPKPSGSQITVHPKMKPSKMRIYIFYFILICIFTIFLLPFLRLTFSNLFEIINQSAIIIIILGCSWYLIFSFIADSSATKWSTERKNLIILPGLLIFIYGGMMIIFSMFSQMTDFSLFLIVSESIACILGIIILWKRSYFFNASNVSI